MKTNANIGKQAFSDGSQGGGRNSLELQISHLERGIAEAMMGIVSAVNMKHVEFIPDLVACNKLMVTVRAACDTADQSLVSVASYLRNQGKEVECDGDVMKRLTSIKDWKSKMDSLADIDSLMDQLYLSSNEENTLANAQLITELETKLRSIAEEDVTVDKLFMERIVPALKGEVVFLRQELRHMLIIFWDQTFSLRELNDKVILQLPASSSDALNEKLSAMDLLNLLDEKISKFVSALMQHFCQRIITSEDPAGVTIYPGAITFAKHEYVVHKEKPPEKGNRRRPDPEIVFRALLELFKNMSKNLGGIIVNKKLVVRLIGDKISGRLVETLVHECLTPAVPYELGDMPAFEELLALSDEFCAEMKNLGFFTDSTQTFQKFADNYEDTFIDRRCSKIVAEARMLIEAPFTEFVVVGSISSTAVETAEEFYKLGLCKGEENDLEEKHYPKLLQLLRCEVSKTAVRFGDLVIRTLNDAAEADSNKAAAKLLQTSRDIVEMYLFSAPRAHDVDISSVPLLAAIFYNNCYYICHRLLTVSLEPKIQNTLKSKNLCGSLTDFIPPVRRVAAESMEKQLTQCRQQLSTLLADDKIFIGLDDASRYKKCTKCLDGCMMQLEQISGIWKKVLTETLYANCMGDIVSFLFIVLTKMLLSTEDIRANDAELSAIVLSKVLKKSQLLLFGDNQSGYSRVHNYAEIPFFRLSEVVFCLEASLQDIYDRWCDGKGPLAQWLRSDEVRHLVKALFQNTEKRAFVLSKIN